MLPIVLRMISIFLSSDLTMPDEKPKNQLENQLFDLSQQGWLEFA